MAVLKGTLAALSKLGIIAAIAVTFLFGLTGAIYLSLRSSEVKVPDVVGKDRMEGESTLSDAGLNLRQRATRYSADAKPNTILDQSPRAGEVIKVGQTVAVVLSRADAKEGESSVSVAKSESKKSGREENKNVNESTSATKNQNENRSKERRDKNANNRNANKNANNSNNANRSNANPNANNPNANNRNANNRNVNINRNANIGDRNANANGNRSVINLNANRRAPVTSASPVNRNTRTP